jgi:energy-coupling factor transport system ATP-binding protein
MSITLKNVSYRYSTGTAEEIEALKNITLTIEDGQFIGLAGHTGSGKSTLIQHLNGLLRPTEGQVLHNGQDLFEKGFDLRTYRTKVGLVFQYPEYQLFETTVLEDACFGPLNQGKTKEEAREMAKRALRSVSVPEELFERSPFELSGGQQRRVAIAGVLAMEPEVLVLDEPTAGLDPCGRTEILDLVKSLQEERKITVVLVSHSMEDIADYVQRLVVMKEGEVFLDDEPKKVFSHFEELEEIGLSAPQVTYLMQDLSAQGFGVPTDCITVEEAKEAILKAVGKC